MATNLKTDYKDYIPPESGKRYIITTDSQGYSTIQDATEYTQEGDTFGANDINTTNNTINNLTAADVGALPANAISSGSNTNGFWRTTRDGTIECWKKVDATSNSDGVITTWLPIEYSNTDYCVQCTFSISSPNIGNIQANASAANQATFLFVGGANKRFVFYLYTIGK